MCKFASTYLPAEELIGHREAVRGNVNTNVMLANLKASYHYPKSCQLDDIKEKLKIIEQVK